MLTSIAVVITLAGVALHFALLWAGRRSTLGLSGETPPERGGEVILLVFAGLVLAFGIAASWYYRDTIKASADRAFLYVGLVLNMIAGMLVRVISANFKQKRALFRLSVSQVAYPLLFSPIVFFSVLSLSSDKSSVMFLLHAAFVNGYFWESLVSDATPVKKG